MEVLYCIYKDLPRKVKNYYFENFILFRSLKESNYFKGTINEVINVIIINKYLSLQQMIKKSFLNFK